MIVLDTNVASAIMRPMPDESVVAWLNREPLDSLWLTSTTVFEIRFGLEILPSGRKRQQLESSFARLLTEGIQGRILPFDLAAAEAAAQFAARRRARGRPVEFRDVEIAGIVAARGATLATRNIRDFEDLKIDIVNPWQA
ncbi:MAG: type II toxin-antitoxin system VapC family toxin [Rhizomicrobium sp.]|jgi:predicted nucleic acid-binding protein